MEYIDICKYVFSEEVVDWELHAMKCRIRQLVLARQISIYLGNWFYPNITDEKLAAMFNQDHSNAQHSISTIKKLLFSDKALRAKMDKYLRVIRERINKEKNEVAVKSLQEMEVKATMLTTIENMELIVKAYCDITGKELVTKTL